MIYILYDVSEIDIPWFNCFRLAFISIYNNLLKNNIECSIIEYNEYYRNINKNDIIILFSPWFRFYNRINKFILYNSESLYVDKNKYFLNLYFEDNVLLWLDYSFKNLNLIQSEISEKISKIEKKYHHLTLSYSITLENLIIHDNNKKIDILFFGSLNKRRLAIKEELEKYSLNVVFGEFTDYNKLYEAISNSKIILVIHYYDEDLVIDHFRINILLSNKIFIIHEEIQKNEDYDDFRDNLIFSKYEEIVSNCLRYLNLSEEDRQLITDNIYNWYKNNHNIENYLPIDDIKKFCD
tara:strand:+ start:386 stop:1270 length:885 start_codon:yes stop_codon:yes gene_type:complete